MSGHYDTPLRTGSRAIRILRKRVKTEDGLGYTSVTLGQEEYTYEVNIDWDQIREMAAAAANSSGNKSHAGPVQVRITGRRRMGGQA